PPGLVTLTSAAPAARAGVVTTIAVEVSEATAAGAPPIVTVAPETNWLPVIVTLVPPLVGPDAGVTAEMTGVGAIAVNVPGAVAACPSGRVTVTATEPTGSAGVRTTMLPAETLCTVPAVAPKRTTVPAVKFAPGRDTRTRPHLC